MIASMVRVHLIDSDKMSDFYFTKEVESLASKMFVDGFYKMAGEFAVLGTGEAAAEEVFDLTNNPGRQASREQLYGRGRSVSVGDMIEVEGEFFLCASFGWKMVDMALV